MKLSIEQIESIAIGTARVEKKDGGIALLRFTKEQEEAYRGWNTDFYNKSFATAGVRLEFATDSSSLFLKVTVRPASSRRFFSHDIFVGGKNVGRLAASFPEGTPINPTCIEGRFALGNGSKTVCIYFPWSFASEICELSLDDGATLSPVEKKRKMIMFGDSITHGYDATVASNSYASKLADFLCANAINKGIGAEIFRPALAALKDDIEPDVITVAYGTNDWGHISKEDFENNCKGFYDNLVKNYPGAKIFAIAPIWRADYDRETAVGRFGRVAEYIKEITAKYDNVKVIDAFGFVPRETSLFSDLHLHPNDEGFKHYADGVCKEIEKYL